jgi:formylglycine-generating enzyme required for sulfatase activity
MIAFSCTACNHRITVKDEFAGKNGKCPKCGSGVTVPGATSVKGVGSRRRESPASGKPSTSIEHEKTMAPDCNTQPRKGVAADGLNTIIGDRGDVRLSNQYDSHLWSFLAPAQQPDELGRLGGYRVLDVLGAGGMGVVFKAQDLNLERLIALKAMLPWHAGSQSLKERFFREAKAAAALKHPHIVTIFQVGEDCGAPYLAMEFLEGESLDSRLKREGKLPLREALSIGRQIAEALAAAHSKDLIHRDIKPANIWLENCEMGQQQELEKGRGAERDKVAIMHSSPFLPVSPSPILSNEPRVKILDFGLARAMSDQAHLTQSGVIIGTPEYMAPEQAGGRNVDHRADVFSLGCVLYQMITGAKPFKGVDTLAILSSLALDTPRPPAECDSRVPLVVSEFVMKLLTKNSEDRPASAATIAQQLKTLESLAPKCGTSSPSGDRTTIEDPTESTRHPSKRQGRKSGSSKSRKRRRDRSAAMPWLVGGGILALLATAGIAALILGPGRSGRQNSGGEAQRSSSSIPVSSSPDPALTTSTESPGSRSDTKTTPNRSSSPTSTSTSASSATTERIVGGLKEREEKFSYWQEGRMGEAKRRIVELDLGGGQKMEFVRIPEGEFAMGASHDEKDASAPERPRHTVTVSKPYYLGKFTVTRGQFRQFIKEDGYKTEAEQGNGGWGYDPNDESIDGPNAQYTWKFVGFDQDERHPVVNVTWNDAQEFIAWLKKKSGKDVRLPTEAEWEYACRAGSETVYHTGTNSETLFNVANVADAAFVQKFAKLIEDDDYFKTNPPMKANDGYVFTAPVGKFKANKFGLHDMNGNVWQWCQDWYSADYYKQCQQEGNIKDPTGPDEDQKERIARGGSWLFPPWYCRSACRHFYEPGIRSIDIGFRVLLVLEED